MKKEIIEIQKTSIKKMNKMSPEELQEFLAFKRKGSVVPAKKGKGAQYRRQQKYKRDMGLG